MSESRFYNGWEGLFEIEFQKPYFQQLKAFLIEEYRTKTIFPQKSQILNAFYHTSPNELNAVILGQDPYINDGQAMGLCFSVPNGVRPPMSLQNIFKEIKDDLERETVVKGGDLTAWANQGVLLLNTTLTVERGKSNSHSGKGWEIFTDAVISYIDKLPRSIVFLLWGQNAISKKRLLKNPSHLVLTAAHPSPLSAYNGFFGCRHFSRANEFLARENKEIKW